MVLINMQLRAIIKERSSDLNRPFDDKVISENYQIKSYEGKSASCFFTDGFGYHRGQFPKLKD